MLLFYEFLFSGVSPKALQLVDVIWVEDVPEVLKDSVVQQLGHRQNLHT